MTIRSGVDVQVASRGFPASVQPVLPAFPATPGTFIIHVACCRAMANRQLQKNSSKGVAWDEQNLAINEQIKVRTCARA